MQTLLPSQKFQVIFSINSFSEEDVEDVTILDIYYKQIQTTWSKIFGILSKMQFEKGMKFINNSLMNDFRKMKEEETQHCAWRIYFCRFLRITPVDKLMASQVMSLLDTFCRLLVD
jgi:hypothetical protein